MGLAVDVSRLYFFPDVSKALLVRNQGRVMRPGACTPKQRKCNDVRAQTLDMEAQAAAKGMRKIQKNTHTRTIQDVL